MSSSRQTLVIVNPHAGGGLLPEDFIGRIEARKGFEVRLTTSEGHAGELAAEGVTEGFSTVVAAGGDGTLNEVVNGLEKGFGNIRLGLLPLGTGNDFARALALPPDLDHALDIVESSHSVPCDVVRLEGPSERRFFINMAAGGASGEVSDRVNVDIKRFWGPFAYLRAALETVSDLAAYRVELKLADGSVHRLDALNLVVANATFIAAGIPIAPLASYDDGLLEIIVFRDCSMARLAAVTAQVMVGAHLSGELEEVLYFRSPRVEVRSEPAMPWNTDGEVLDPQPIRFEVVPGALRLAAPPIPTTS